MDIKNVLSVIAGIVFIAGFVPYVLAILGRDIFLQKIEPTKPAKASWIIWISLDSITLAGMCAKDSVNGQIIGAVVGGWVVVAFALKYGTRGWSNLDKFCLAGAFLGIVLWKAFDNPIMGIVTCQAVTFIGSIPTFASAWKDPGHEDKLSWTIFWISCSCAMLAIPHLTIEDIAQPTTFFLIETTMMYILYLRKSKSVVPKKQFEIPQ